jgi:AraC family transcriptional regulator, regulatory protein of adaptative response / methylphosphotriester-DNA alkyltransferase methyltransferase
MPIVPEEYWKAIVDCDAGYDETFLYAVKTTRIFCRPSCRSREPKRENVRIFKNSYMALAEGFRPCKRCRPDGVNLPAEEWIMQIRIWIDHNYNENITLRQLAELFHGSPFHLQRLFKRVIGMTPTEYIQKLRLEKAMILLVTDEKPIVEIAEEVGFRGAPYFITLFKRKHGCTPAAFRRKEGNDLEK